MDAVSLFAAVVFVASWWFLVRVDADDPLGRLFFASLMVMAAAVGALGFLLRALS